MGQWYTARPGCICTLFGTGDRTNTKGIWDSSDITRTVPIRCAVSRKMGSSRYLCEFGPEPAPGKAGVYWGLYARGMIRAPMPCHGAYLGLRNSKHRLVAWMAVVVYLATAAAARARLLLALRLLLDAIILSLPYLSRLMLAANKGALLTRGGLW